MIQRFKIYNKKERNGEDDDDDGFLHVKNWSEKQIQKKMFILFTTIFLATLLPCTGNFIPLKRERERKV